MGHPEFPHHPRTFRATGGPFAGYFLALDPANSARTLTITIRNWTGHYVLKDDSLLLWVKEERRAQ